jgi:hypothetical protein
MSSTARFERLVRRHRFMKLNRLDDLFADAMHGVERGHRLLENHRDIVAANLAHVLDGQLRQIAAFEQDF